MYLTELVDVSARIQATPSRQEKIARLCEWLRRAPVADISTGVHYLSGRLPQGRIGVGAALIESARATPAAARPSLVLTDVDRAFAELARTAGAGSQAERQRRMNALFARATAAERDFLIRLLHGDLRQGALEGVMLEAVACAAATPVADVRRAAMVAGNLGAVARAALEEGARGLGRFALHLLQPVHPMLAQSATDPHDALERLGGEAAFEYKLDGVRLQAHKSGGEVRIYTRRLKDVTASAPDLVDAVRRLPASGLILDGEAIAVAPGGAPLPFQQTMRRFGRKQEVERLRTELPLSAFFFDCLHCDGRDLIAQPARERFRALGEAVPPALVVPRCVTANPAEAVAFLAGALERGHEGLLAKSLGAPYEAGRRGGAWLKLKAAHTLDLVVLAAEWGHGRRHGWLSNLHLGAREPAGGSYVMLGKTFKGMTDRMLAWQTERLLQLEIARDAHTVYVRPALVVEIAFNGIQASPHYAGGLALRFARVKRYREDKTPEEADTLETVRALYAGQVGQKAPARANAAEGWSM